MLLIAELCLRRIQRLEGKFFSHKTIDKIAFAHISSSKTSHFFSGSSNSRHTVTIIGLHIIRAVLNYTDHGDKIGNSAAGAAG